MNKQTILYIAAAIVTIIVVVVILVIGFTDSGKWSEWTPIEPEKTCGAGVQRFKRSCSIGSIARAFGRTCADASGLSDTKTETYRFNNQCPPAGKVGRFVIIERMVDLSPIKSSDDNALNIAEISVLGVDGDLTKNATAISGSTKDDSHGASNLLDGSVDTFAFTDAGKGRENQWFKIDLGENKDIRFIKITNRADCCKHRSLGARLRVQNDAGVNVFLTPLGNFGTASFMIE
jgi:hypothetical protein